MTSGGVPLKTLYYIPVAHSLNEVNADIAKTLRDTDDPEILAGWEKYEEELKKYWQSIELWLYENIKDFRDVVIYLDALPVLDHKYISLYFFELLSGCPTCPNYQCVKWLLDQGASLEGTEHFRLLRVLETTFVEIIKNPHICSFYEPWIDNINHLRDRFVAQRINATLPNGSLGLLFMGCKHMVVDELRKISKNIRIIIPSVCYASPTEEEGA